MTGTSLEQFKNALVNPSARRAIGIDVSDVEAARIVADETLSRAYYENWLKAERPYPRSSPVAPPPYVPGAPAVAAAPLTPQSNPVGVVALAAAIIGTVFACWPGGFIIGWVLLPIAFILSIVAVALPRKRRGVAFSALIVSIVGTVAGFIVFFAALGSAFSDPPLLTAVSEPGDASTAEKREEPAPPVQEAPSNLPDGFRDTGQGVAIRFVEDPSCGDYVRCSQVEVLALKACPNTVYIEANMLDGSGRNLGITNDMLGSLAEGDRGLVDLMIFDDAATRVELSDVTCY